MIDQFYLWTAGLLGHWLLATIGAASLLLLLYAEHKFRRGRHLLAATFVFMWLMFDIFNGLGIVDYAANVAWSRWARLWTILVPLWLALWDLKYGRN